MVTIRAEVILSEDRWRGVGVCAACGLVRVASWMFVADWQRSGIGCGRYGSSQWMQYSAVWCVNVKMSGRRCTGWSRKDLARDQHQSPHGCSRRRTNVTPEDAPKRCQMSSMQRGIRWWVTIWPARCASRDGVQPVSLLLYVVRRRGQGVGESRDVG